MFVDIALGSVGRRFGLLFFNEAKRTTVETLGLLFKWLSIADTFVDAFFR